MNYAELKIAQILDAMNDLKVALEHTIERDEKLIAENKQLKKEADEEPVICFIGRDAISGYKQGYADGYKQALADLEAE